MTKDKYESLLEPDTRNPSIWLVISETAKGVSLTSTVAHEAEELLLFTAGPAAPSSQSNVRVTGEAVRFRWAVALPAGGVAL